MLLRTIVTAWLIACSASVAAQTWAIAKSKHSSEDKVIVFRYVQDFSASHKREAFPVRAVIVWQYQGSKGMPVTPERERMERLEDLLEPALERLGLATLVLVSTGNGSREWTYYAKSEDQFFSAINKALAQETRFPIDIHVGNDPKWTTYDQFRKQVRE